MARPTRAVRLLMLLAAALATVAVAAVAAEPTEVAFGAAASGASSSGASSSQEAPPPLPPKLHWDDVEFDKLTPKERSAALAAKAENARTEARAAWLQREIARLERAIARKDDTEVKVYKQREDRELGRLREEVSGLRRELLGIKAERERRLAEEQAKALASKVRERALKRKEEQDGKAEQVRKTRMRKEEAHQKDLAARRDESKAKLQAELDRYTKDRDLSVKKQMKYERLAETSAKRAARAIQAKLKADEANAKRVAATKKEVDAQVAAEKLKAHQLEQAHKQRIATLKAEEQRRKKARAAEKAQKKKMEQGHKEERAKQEAERKAAIKASELEQKGNEADRKLAAKLLAKQDADAAKQLHQRELAEAAKRVAEQQTKQREIDSRNANKAAQIRADKLKAQLQAAEETRKAAMHAEATARAQKNRDAARRAQEETEKAERAEQKAERARQAAEQDAKAAEQKEKSKREEAIKARAAEEEATKERMAAARLKEQTEKARVKAEQADKKAERERQEQAEKDRQAAVHEYERAARKVKAAVQLRDDSARQAAADRKTADDAQKEADALGDKDPPRRAQLQANAVAKTRVWATSATRAKALASAAVPVADAAATKARATKHQPLVVEATAAYNEAQKTEIDVDGVRQAAREELELRTRLGAETQAMAKAHLQAQEEAEKAAQKAEEDKKAAIKAAIKAATKARVTARTAQVESESGAEAAAEAAKEAAAEAERAAEKKTVAAWKRAVEKAVDALDESRVAKSRAASTVAAGQVFVRLAEPTEQDATRKLAADELKEYEAALAAIDLVIERATAHLAAQRTGLKAAEEKAAALKAAAAKRVDEARPRELEAASPHKAWGRSFRLPQYALNEGACHLSGVVRAIALERNAKLLTLPSACRPSNRLVFSVAVGEAGEAAQVDVFPDGTVAWVAGALTEDGPLVLDGVFFTTAGSAMTALPINTEGWANYGAQFRGASFRVERDVCYLSGVIRTVSGKPDPWARTLVDRLPEGCRPLKGASTEYFTVSSGEHAHVLSVSADGRLSWAGGERSRFWLSLDGVAFAVGGFPDAPAERAASAPRGNWSRPDGAEELATGAYRSGELCVVTGAVVSRVAPGDAAVMRLPEGCHPESGLVSARARDVTGARHTLIVMEDGTVRWDGPEGAPKKGVAVGFGGLRFVVAPEQSWEKDAAVRVANEQEAERLAKEAALRAAQRYARAAAVPKPVSVASDFETYGAVYRPPQYSRAGPFCMMSGLARRLGSFKGVAVKGLPDACLDRAPVLAGSVTGTAEAVTVLVDPKTRSLKWAAGAAAGNYLPLDGVQFAVNAAEDNGTRLGTAKDLTLGEGFTGAARVVQWEAVCGLAGTVVASAKITAAQSQNGALLARLPATCRPDATLVFAAPTAGGSSLTVEVRESGDVVLRSATVGTLPAVSLARVMFTVGGERTALEPADGYRNQGSPYRGISFRRQGWLCVVTGTLSTEAGAHHVTTLPDGCRPSSGRLIFTTARGNSPQRVDLLPDGRVVLVAGATKGARGMVSLDGIQFTVAEAQEWEDDAVQAADKKRADRAAEAAYKKRAEENAKAAAAAAKLKQDSTPVPVDAVAPRFEPMGLGRRFPQVAMTPHMCVLSGGVVATQNGTSPAGVAVLKNVPAACRPDGPLRLAAFGVSGGSPNATAVPSVRGELVMAADGSAKMGASAGPATYFSVSPLVVPRKGASAAKPLPLEGSYKRHGDDALSVAPTYVHDAAFGLCALYGVVGPLSASARHMATLPAECRPDRTVFFNAAQGPRTVRVSVDDRGRVMFAGMLGGDKDEEHYVSLAGLSYSPKADKGDKLTLGEGWAKYGAAEPRVRQHKNLCVASGQAEGREAFVAKVPALCRPASGSVIFFVNAFDRVERVELTSSGNLVWRGRPVDASAKARLSLDGLVWLVAPEQKWETNARAALRTQRAQQREAQERAARAHAAKWARLSTPEPLELENGYEPRGPAVRVPQHVRFGSLCVLSGLAATQKMETIGAQLPPRCAPLHREAFGIDTRRSTTTRFDITEEGAIPFVAGGDGRWVSYDGMIFVANDTTNEQGENKPHTLSLDKAWKPLGGKFQAPTVAVERGLCLLSGVINSTLNKEGRFAHELIGTVPDACRPRDGSLIMHANRHNVSVRLDLSGDGKLRIKADAPAPGITAVSLSGLAWFPRSSGSVKPAAGFGALGDGFRPPSFHREGSFCALSGVLQGTRPDGTGAVELLTLPAECRPASGMLLFTVNHHTRTESVMVRPDGRVMWRRPSTSERTWISLDGVHFVVNKVQAWETEAKAAIVKRNAERRAARAAAFLKLAEPTRLEVVPGDSTANFSLSSDEAAARRWPQFARYNSLCLLSGAGELVGRSKEADQVLAQLPKECRSAGAMSFPAVDYRHGGVAAPRTLVLGSKVAKEHGLVRTEGGFENHTLYSFDGVVFAGVAPGAADDSVVSKPLALTDSAWQAGSPDEDHESNWEDPTVTFDSGVCVLSGVVSSSAVSQTQRKHAFKHTGADQKLVVPRGTKGLFVKLWGASGGGGKFLESRWTSGAGAYTEVMVPEELSEAGGTLVVRVGGGGTVSPAGKEAAAGAYPAGGRGFGGTGTAGGGGGRTEVLFNGVLLAVAAGGGGSTGYGGHAGAGGGLRGQDGYLTGRGATQTAGGLNHDKSGAKFAGGRGGTSVEDDGAGGGDGYFGGSGGGGDAHSGGGGSGYINREKGVRGVMLSGFRAEPPATDDGDYPGGNVARGVPSEGRAGNPGFAMVILDAERGPDEWARDATVAKLPWQCRPRDGSTLTLSVGGGRRVRVHTDGRLEAQALESRSISLGGAAYFVAPGEPLKLATGKPFGEPYRAPGLVRAYQLCALSGVLKEAEGELLATLPAACRPSGELEFVVYASDSTGERVRVLPNGEVRWPAWTPQRALSLDGVHFVSTGAPANWEVALAKARAEAKAGAAEARLAELHELAAPARVELLNNDTYYGHGSRVPQVSRHGALCVVSGMLKGEDLAKPVARLPASCRPENELAFDVHLDDTATASFVVKKDGTVQRAEGSSRGEFVSLDGLSFVHKGAEDVRREALTLAANFEGAGGDFGSVPSVSLEDGVCVLEGMLKARNATLWRAGSLVATLPRHCWPVGGSLVFKANSGVASHRVDIFADGRIVWAAGQKAGTRLSLSGIVFAPEAPHEPVAFGPGWEAYGMEYRQPAVTRAGAMCVVTGLVRADGGADTGKHVATLPAGCRPSGALTFADSHGANVERVTVRENGHVEWVPVLKSDEADLKQSWLTLDGIAFVAVPEPAFETKVKESWQAQYEKEQKAEAERAAKEAAEKAKADAKAKAEAEKAKAEAAAKAKEEAEKARAAEKAEEERQKAAAEDKSKSGHRMELADGVEPMGRGYAVPQVIKLSKTLCLLQGVAYASNMRRVVATLPKECRPSGRVVMLGQTTGVHNTRHDVMPTGEVKFVSSTSKSGGGIVSFGGLAVIGADADIRDVQLREPQMSNMGDPYVDATYVRLGNLCVLQGVAAISSMQRNIGVLDRECRPNGRLIFQVSNGMGNHWRVDVTTGGEVIFDSYGNGANGGFHKQVSLSGISFFRGGAVTPLSLASGWAAYGYGYRAPSWRREGKACALSGLARGNRFGLLAVVPPECRPSRRMIFSVNMHQYSQRVDVMEDGRVLWKDGNLAHGWLSLDGIIWSPNTYKLKVEKAEDKPLQVGKPTVLQGWEAQGGDYRGPQYARFGQLCMLSGVLTSKSGVLNRPMLRLPEGCRPGDGTHVFNAHTDHAHVVRFDVSPSGKVAWKGGATEGTYVPITSTLFAVEGARREELHLDSRYVHYEGGYAKASLTLDGDLCVLQGMIRDPHYRTMPGGLLATLPPDCRPKDGRLIFSVNHNDILHRVDVLKNGQVHYITGHRKYSWTSLDGLALVGVSGTQPLTGLNGWTEYGYGYRRPSYRMVGNGKVCVLSGLFRGGHGHALTRLPKQCRPDRRLVHFINGHEYGLRLDIFPDGRIMHVAGYRRHGWASLDGIRFVADKAPEAALTAYKVVKADTPTAITSFTSGVKALGDEWSVPSFQRSGPLCVLSGVLHTGDSMKKVLFRLPSTCRPDGHLAFNLASAAAHTERVDVYADGQVRWVAGAAHGHWLSLDGVQFTVAGTRHNPLELLWQYVPLGRGYRKPQITRVGSLCVMSGMVRTENYQTNWWSREVAKVDHSCVPRGGRLIFRQNLDQWTHRLDVLPDGRLYLTHTTIQRPYFSLDGMAYSAEEGHPLHLLPGWNHYYSGYRHGSYVKEGNLCVLSGLLNGNGAVHMATLPRECRPAKRSVFWVDADQHNMRIDVLPDGRLIFKGPRYRSWVPLDGIRFTVSEFLAVASPDERASITKEGTQIDLLDGFRNANNGFRNAVWTRVGKFCVLSGKVSSNDIRGRIGRLPKECRPAKTLMFDTHNGKWNSYPFTVRVDVQPDGIVKWASSYSWDQSSGNYISLDGISFAVHDAKDRLMLSHKAYLNHYRPAPADGRYSGVEITIDGDVCHVQGLAVQPHRDTASHGHVVQLPGNCRPKEGSVIFNGNLGQTTGRVTVHMSGHVQYEAGSAKHNFVSLSNIFFFRSPGTALQMRSGWGAQGGGSQHWRKPSWKRVKLGGRQLCIVAGLALGSRRGTMAVLPLECRPMERLQFEANNHQYVRRVDVFPDGRLVNMFDNSHGWVALDGVAFVVPESREESAYPLVDDGKMTTKAVKLVNGFEDYKRGYRTPSFSKWGKLCMLQGVARTPGKRLDHVAAQVPAECQPAGRVVFNRMTKADATFRLDVTTDGAVRYAAGNADSDSLSLDGLVWPAKDAPQGTVELASKWVPQGRGYAAPGWVRQGDLCVLTGMARTHNGHYGEFSNQVALLPGDCRPEDGQIIFYANTQDDTFRMDVQKNGQVVVHAHGRRGIRFPTISLADVHFFVKSERIDLWSGWSAYNRGYRQPGFNAQGAVCALSGLANGNGRRELGRLPRECRPRARVWFNVNHHQYMHRVDIMTDGRIVWVSPSSRAHSWLSLDGILFERQPFKDD